MQASTIQRPSRLQVLTALKHPSFRRFWSGLVASVLGFQIMTVAQGWLVYDLTGSKLYLGYVGLAVGLPAIVLNLFGGVIADIAEALHHHGFAAKIASEPRRFYILRMPEKFPHSKLHAAPGGFSAAEDAAH